MLRKKTFLICAIIHWLLSWFWGEAVFAEVTAIIISIRILTLPILCVLYWYLLGNRGGGSFGYTLQ